MNDKKDKVSIIKEAKAIHQQDKEAHQREVNEIIQETYYAPGSKQRTKEYQKAKTMKWWHYLTALIIGLILTGISFAINYTIDLQTANYFNYGMMFGILLFMMIINYWKNRQAAKFFNDRRRRYQRTLRIGEAKVFLTLKTIFLSLLFFLPTIITLGILWW